MRTSKWLLLPTVLASAGWSDGSPARPSKLDSAVVCERPQRVRLRIGLRVQAAQGPIQDALASVAIPIDWPEQQVELVSSDEPADVQVDTRAVGGTAAQMLLRLPQLARGSEVISTRIYELTRWAQRFRPEARERLGAARPRQVQAYLQPSDGIE